MANNKRRATSNAGEKSGHVVVSAFCCLPSLFIQFVFQAISLLVDLSKEGRRQKISSQLDGKSIKLLAKRSVSWLNNRQAARQSIDRSAYQLARHPVNDSGSWYVCRSDTNHRFLSVFLSCCFKLRSCAFYWRRARLWKLETRIRPPHWTALITNRYLNAWQGSTQSIGSVFRHPIYVQV